MLYSMNTHLLIQHAMLPCNFHISVFIFPKFTVIHQIWQTSEFLLFLSKIPHSIHLFDKLANFIVFFVCNQSYRITIDIQKELIEQLKKKSCIPEFSRVTKCLVVIVVAVNEGNVFILVNLATENNETDRPNILTAIFEPFAMFKITVFTFKNF